MKRTIGLTGAWKGLAAIALALVVGVVAASQAGAANETVRLGRATVAPGAQGTVTLEALDIASPGLGAWEIGVTYNSSVVTAVACAPGTGSVCNTHFSSNQVRVVGAFASGHVGDSALAGITFECANRAGTTSLTVTVLVLADGTVGTPRAIAADVVHGSIDCTGAAGGAPTRRPTRRATEAPAEATPNATAGGGITGLPKTGGGSSGDGQLFWLFAGLSAAGFAAMASAALATKRVRGR